MVAFALPSGPRERGRLASIKFGAAKWDFMKLGGLAAVWDNKAVFQRANSRLSLIQ